MCKIGVNNLLICIILGFSALLTNCTTAENESNASGTSPTSGSKTIGNGNLFVFAPSGLNLRTQADLQSEVVINIPNGTEIKPTGEEDNISSEIEGLEGKMIKVSFDGKEGYVFSGFLAPYPYPENYDLQSYVQQLKSVNINTDYLESETPETDSSFAAFTDSVAFPGENNRKGWQQAWVVAKAFGFMNHKEAGIEFAFPGPGRNRTLYNLATKELFQPKNRAKNDFGHWEETYELDNLSGYLWFVSITITTDEQDNLISISEFTRQEGSGSTIELSYTDSGNFLLSRNSYAD